MTNIKKEDFKFGDIIATRSNTFLSKSIRWFMKRYNKKSPNFSHIAVVINVYDELWIAEALKFGVRIWPIEQSRYLTKKQVVILRHKKGFNTDQINLMSKKMVSLGGTRYQYENLFQWIFKIIFNINIFKNKNEKSIYCSELGAIAINESYPNSFPHPNIVSPADHFLSNYYDIIDINKVM